MKEVHPFFDLDVISFVLFAQDSEPSDILVYWYILYLHKILISFKSF